MSTQSKLRELNGFVLVSACLLGVKCRYDGKSTPNQKILDLKNITPIPVCPEQLGGLPTPRPKAWFAGGDGHAVLGGEAKLINEEGHDVTDRFIQGAHEACRIADLLGIRFAILKARSPSCGVHAVYVNQELCRGQGISAAMLASKGIVLLDDQEVV